MTPERWQEIERLFHAVLNVKPEERAAFLDAACANDARLRDEVEALLRSDGDEANSVEMIPSIVAAAWVKQSGEGRLVGRVMGRYRIVAPLGSGGMGEVYLAEDTTLNRKVALKLLPAHFTQDRDRLRRFDQEARAASALNHPNIITIYEIGQWDNTQFIATEFIEGKTLRDRMQLGRMPLPEILEIGTQVAGALAAAHAAGIVHRDIKPANIMVRTDGYVKVLDFGLAKLTATVSAQADRTDLGRVMGTINYMSPEQALGQPLDDRTDLFSLGVVLYEIATGARPFEGESDAAIYDAILNKAPPTRANPILPPELDRIIRHALEKDREREIPDRQRSARRLEAAGAQYCIETSTHVGRSSAPRADAQCRKPVAEFTNRYHRDCNSAVGEWWVLVVTRNQSISR